MPGSVEPSATDSRGRATSSRSSKTEPKSPRLLTRLALNPIRRITKGAEALLEGGVGQRLPVQEEDEMGQLAQVINRGLDKTEQSYRKLEQFAADASHELKSPLTAIMLQSSLGPGAGEEDASQRLAHIRKAAGGMKVMIDDLLLAARAGQSSLEDRVTAPLEGIMQGAADEAGPWAGFRSR